MIPYGRQNINDEDIQSVVEVLRSDWLTQGPAVKRFELAMAAYCGAKYAVAVNSATSALHIACLASGLGEGDTLWTSPNTFVASANSGRYCGAAVDFVDIDPRTYNLSVDCLAEKLEQASRQGGLPKVLIPVHFSGQPCQMAEIADLAGRYGVTIIEDASHAVGAAYRGVKVGACESSAMTVFSFHPVKLMTTGEGGLVLTNNERLYDSLMRLRSHGITRDESLMGGVSDGAWYYQQIELGFNYRMTDIQAALGTSQLRRLDEFVERRRILAQRYNYLLDGLPLITPWQHPDCASSWHLYVIRLPKQNRSRVFNALREADVGVNVHYIPVHLQPYYRHLGFNPGDFQEAENYYSEAISLPMYPGLTEDQQLHVVHSLSKAIGT